jgi:hypothetical protein
MRRLACAFAWACLVAVVAAPAGAAVRVDEDEVVFTARAAGAKSVFLVGTFNNWNPTVEPMAESAPGVFEISLFLVAGSYRYKYVIDGVWTVDPENPGGNPALGSPLALEERAGALALSTDEPEPAAGAPRTVNPFLRYIGDFRWEEGESQSFQRADVGARLDRDLVRGRAVLASTDDTWTTAEAFQVAVDRASLEAQLGGLVARGTENDSVWTSEDPFTLVGQDGVYRYDAGFGRHGVSAVWPIGTAADLRALYDDDIARAAVPPPRVDGDVLAGFEAGVAPDTTLYAYRPTRDGSDRLALDLAVRLGDARVGYTRRDDRGLHPGLAAAVARDSASFRVSTQATREDRSAQAVWLRFERLLLGADLALAYGWASSDLRLLEAATWQVPTLAAGVAAGVGEPQGGCERFETSDRWTVAVARERGDVAARLGWDFVDFAFEGVEAGGRARIHRLDAEVSWNGDGEGTGASLAARYTDQDYADTPDALLVDSPERNLWLQGRDTFSIADIVGIDRRVYGWARLRVDWASATPQWVPAAAHAEAGAAGKGFLATLDYAWLEAGAEWAVGAGFYGLLDGRLARYDKPAWGGLDTFAAGYVEAGWRYRGLLLDLGYGFDPVVFDPVVNDYAPIGRIEVVRSALGDPVRRSEAALIGARVLERERALEGVHAIKLECIIRF